MRLTSLAVCFSAFGALAGCAASDSSENDERQAKQEIVFNNKAKQAFLASVPAVTRVVVAAIQSELPDAGGHAPTYSIVSESTYQISVSELLPTGGTVNVTGRIIEHPGENADARLVTPELTVAFSALKVRISEKDADATEVILSGTETVGGEISIRSTGDEPSIDLDLAIAGSFTLEEKELPFEASVLSDGNDTLDVTGLVNENALHETIGFD